MEKRIINRFVILSLFLLILNISLVRSFDVSCEYHKCSIQKLTAYYNLNLSEAWIQLELQLDIHNLKSDESNITFYLTPYGYQDELLDFKAVYFEDFPAGIDYRTGFSVKNNSKFAIVKTISPRQRYNPNGKIYTSYDYTFNISVKNESIYTLVIDFMTPNLLTHIGTEYFLDYEIDNPDDTPNHEIYIIFPQNITPPKTKVDYDIRGKPPLARWLYYFDNKNPIRVTFESIPEKEAHERKLRNEGIFIGSLLSLLTSWLLYLFIEKRKPSIDKNYFNNRIRTLIKEERKYTIDKDYFNKRIRDLLNGVKKKK